jgi:tRNA(Ile)-lysidine synthase
MPRAFPQRGIMRLRRLEPVLRRALRGPCGCPAGATLLVAVSGGADSTALLVALASLAREFDLRMHAAHLDHGLRADSRADAGHVRALCERLCVPLIAARWDTRARMRAAGTSGEQGLRLLRRRFLRAAMRRAGAVAIVTAHTADDQLETVLMRLARGASVRGLAGMRPRHGVWIKPLLEATRHDVERDLTQARIVWREDASNRERTYLRNRIRLDVVPALLNAFAPGSGGDAAARASLARRASAGAAELRMAGALFAQRARAAFASASIASDARALDSRALAAYPETIQRHVLQLLWDRTAPAETRLSRRHLDALQRLVVSRRGGSAVALPQGWTVRWSRNRLILLPPASVSTRERTVKTLHPLNEPTDDRLQSPRAAVPREGSAGPQGRRAPRAKTGRTPRRTLATRVRSGVS